MSRFDRMVMFISLSWLSPVLIAGVTVGVMRGVFGPRLDRPLLRSVASAIFAVDLGRTALTARALRQQRTGGWELAGRISNRMRGESK